MAETEKTLVEAGKEVMEATAPDAPKKNAVAAEPMKKVGDAEDLGPAVVKPTDSNPDATKKVKQVSGDAQQKNAGAADPMPSVKKEETKDSEDKEIKEGELPAGLKKYLDKKDDKKEMAEPMKKKDDAKSEREKRNAKYESFLQKRRIRSREKRREERRKRR